MVHIRHDNAEVIAMVRGRGRHGIQTGTPKKYSPFDDNRSAKSYVVTVKEQDVGHTRKIKVTAPRQWLIVGGTSIATSYLLLCHHHLFLQSQESSQCHYCLITGRPVVQMTQDKNSFTEV